MHNYPDIDALGRSFPVSPFFRQFAVNPALVRPSIPVSTPAHRVIKLKSLTINVHEQPRQRV